ncbi:MAG: hypothetical protein ACFFC7_05720 [Candidatus Hermodarchaeota archaeon]
MTFIEDVVASWGINLLTWYAQTFMILVSPEMLLVQVELLVLIYLVLQVLGLVFPVVKRLTTLIFLPFRVLHVWFHLDAANKLDLQTPNSEESLVITRFFTSVNSDDRASLGIKAPKNTRDAYRIATAPTKGALVLIGLSFLLSPILFMFGVVGFFIHLYILLGSLTTLWADSKDYLFVYQTAVLNADLSPRYLAWTVLIFAVSFIGTLVITNDLFRAFLSGVGLTFFYILALVWLVARISAREKTPISLEKAPIIETTALSPFPEITLPSCRP